MQQMATTEEVVNPRIRESPNRIYGDSRMHVSGLNHIGGENHSQTESLWDSQNQPRDASQMAHAAYWRKQAENRDEGDGSTCIKVGSNIG